jgi:hypothetical protein
VDVALVHTFTQSKWKPDTMWDSCKIRLEARESSFVLMDYLICGALLCPVFESDTKLYYIVDTVNGDMFLRVNGCP